MSSGAFACSRPRPGVEKIPEARGDHAMGEGGSEDPLPETGDRMITPTVAQRTHIFTLHQADAGPETAHEPGGT